MSLQIAILKLLAARRDGEAEVATLSKELSILVSSKDGDWVERQRAMAPRKPLDLFSDGLITQPRKGCWKISQAGLRFLHALELEHGRDRPTPADLARRIAERSKALAANGGT